MAKYILLALFILSSFQLSLGQKITIYGYVKEKASKEPIVGAAVFSPNLETGTYSNELGFYSISLNCTQTNELKVYQSSYQSQVYSFDCQSSLRKDFFLSSLETDTVSITAQSFPFENTQGGIVKLSAKEIERMPALLGERDVLKALQQLPGIKQGAEGSSGLHVRGGSPDQNLILLDDVPLYYVSHLAGLFSLFDPDAISQAKVFKGIAPARYMGRSSAVVDLRIKEGNKKTHKKRLVHQSDLWEILWRRSNCRRQALLFCFCQGGYPLPHQLYRQSV